MLGGSHAAAGIWPCERFYSILGSCGSDFRVVAGEKEECISIRDVQNQRVIWDFFNPIVAEAEEASHSEITPKMWRGCYAERSIPSPSRSISLPTRRQNIARYSLIPLRIIEVF